jgi:hypothetical protein
LITHTHIKLEVFIFFNNFSNKLYWILEHPQWTLYFKNSPKLGESCQNTQ